MENWKGIINKYRQFLPVNDKTPVITLNEGNTPLIEASEFSKILGNNLKVFIKFEGMNPTGSFKDRGMTVAISKALEEGSKAVICASTGNTSASAAAYAARAKIKCVVIIPNGAIALGKLSQALMHNAKVIALDGNFDDALNLVKIISEKYPIKLVNSINPYRIEGQKTAAFEVCEQIEGAASGALDYLVIPVGNAGNITSYWKGFNEFMGHKKIKKLPKMVGLQAEGAAPIVNGKVVKEPKTIASAIRIGSPARWKEAEAAIKESDGRIDIVSDEQIIDAYRMLASKEGIFVEPASAASIAGILKLNKQNYFMKGSKIVCICTGHGLKDPDCAIKNSPKPVDAPNDLGRIVDLIFKT